MDFFNFEHVPVSEIKIGARLRKEHGDIDSLEKSITNFGLLQPIIVTQDIWLVAGERRFRAIKNLGWKTIPAIILPVNYSGATA